MTKFRRAILATPLIFATTLLPAAQNHHNNNAYYSGMRDGARGGSYYDNRDRPYHYDHRQPNQGGIGPGKGALIGGAGGAVLGAVFGGGLKGTIIGGAAGAGIGAVIGQAAQNNRRDKYGRPY
jgi:hypothetical protein